MSTDSTHEPRTGRPSRLRAPLAFAAILAALALAACGGSSSSSTGTKAVASTSPQNGANRFAALRECLQKQGVTLPSRPAGSGSPGSGAPPTDGAEGFKPPAGGSQSKLQEAIKKCGGGAFPGRGARPSSATARAALTKYTQCMRENGVSLPAPNTSGKGPVFDTKGIDTTSSTFKNAQKSCQSRLKGAFGAPSGSGQAGPPPGGAPPGGAEEGSVSG